MIQETQLNSEWQAILYIVLQQKFAQFLQEYETQYNIRTTKYDGVITRSNSIQNEQQKEQDPSTPTELQ